MATSHSQRGASQAPEIPWHVPPPHDHYAQAAREVGQFELGGRLCRILLVDGVVPGHPVPGDVGNAQTPYVEGEIAHFEFDGHCYALTLQRPVPKPDGDGRLTDARDIIRLLSSRELQVVQLVSLGLLTKQVADRLQISEFTVRSYLKSIYAKLGVRSRAALVCRYMQAYRSPTCAGE